MGTVTTASGVKNWTVGGSGDLGCVSLLNADDNLVAKIGTISIYKTGIELYDVDGNPITFIGEDTSV